MLAQLLAALGQGVDLGPKAQQAGVCRQSRQLRGALRGLPCVQLLLPAGRCQCQLCLGQLAAGVWGQQRHIAQGLQRRLLPVPLAQRRQHPAHPLQRQALGLQRVQAGPQLAALVLELAHPRVGFDPVPGAHGGGLEPGLRRRQRVGGDVIRPAGRFARRPQRIGLGGQLVAHRAQAADARGRLEQDLADVVLGTQDRLAARRQPALVQAEHLVKEVAVGAAQPDGQRRLGQRLALGVEQRAVARLVAHKGQRLATMGQRGAQPQVGLDVHKVEGRPGLDAVEQVQDGAAGGGFAGLVGTDDDMKIPRSGRKVQPALGELAVGQQVELLDAHRAALGGGMGSIRAGEALLSAPAPAGPAGPAPPRRSADRSHPHGSP